MKPNDHEPLPSSNKPWYYVPGKNYLSEQRLAAKHDLEIQKQFQNEKNNKYFSKCNREAKLFSNWEKNKRLVKNSSPKSSSAPPFRIEDKEQIESDKRFFCEHLEDLTRAFNEYQKSNNICQKSFIDSSAAVYYLMNQIELMDDIKEKRDDFFKIWEKYQNTIGVYSNNNDPLRQVSFKIRQLLSFYKSTLSNNLNRLKQLYENDFFSDAEQNELQELNNRCLQIIDMYLDLNEMRDHHFQNMFYEERECHWMKQKTMWKEEIQVWDNLFMKLFDSNYLLIRNRIEEIMDKQKTLLKERLTQFENLKYFIEQSNDNYQLRPILYFDIEQLKSSSS